MGRLLAPHDMGDIVRQLGPRPPTDGRDGPALPRFVFWCMSLVMMPIERMYEISFGTSPTARLDAVLQHVKGKLVQAQ